MLNDDQKTKLFKLAEASEIFYDSIKDEEDNPDIDFLISRWGTINTTLNLNKGVINNYDPNIAVLYSLREFHRHQLKLIGSTYGYDCPEYKNLKQSIVEMHKLVLNYVPSKYGYFPL